MTLAGIDVGSIPGWITSAGIVGLLAVILNFILKNKAGDREGWGALITALQNDVALVREQHRQCEARLGKVEAQLVGVHRQLIMQASMGIAVPPSDETRAAAERAIGIIRKQLDEDEAEP